MTGDDDKSQLNKPVFAPFLLLNSSANFVTRFWRLHNKMLHKHICYHHHACLAGFFVEFDIGRVSFQTLHTQPNFYLKRTNLTDSLFDDLFAFLHAFQAELTINS